MARIAKIARIAKAVKIAKLEKAAKLTGFTTLIILPMAIRLTISI